MRKREEEEEEEERGEKKNRWKPDCIFSLGFFGIL